MEYAMIFPGQATQISDPRKGLKGFRGAKEVFALGKEVFGEVYDQPEEELAETYWQHPAVTLHSLAVAAALKEKNFPRPEAVAGHSLGVFSSLIYTEVLPGQIGWRLVKERGLIIQKWSDQKPGQMAAVIGLCYDDVKFACEEISKQGKIVVAANYNEPRQIVISGQPEGVEEACGFLKKNFRSPKIIILPTSVGFHSPLLKEASEEFNKVLLLPKFCNAQNQIRILVDDNVMQGGMEIKMYMRGHMLRPVFWAHSVMNILVEFGIRNFLVVGPGQKMARMIERTAEFCRISGVKAVCLSTGEEIKTFLDNPFA